MRAPTIRRHVLMPRMLLAVTCLAIGGLVAIGGVMLLRPASPLPDNIRRQVTFTVFMPEQPVRVDTQSYKFSPTEGVLSFVGTMSNGQKVTFAEQAAPGPFSDIANFYQQFLQTLHEYQAFDVFQGTVHLTHPNNAGQAAVLYAHGTLLFARVDKDESLDTWRQVFTKITVYQP